MPKGICSASTATPNHWYSTRVGRPKSNDSKKTNPEACICVVGYNAQVDRRIVEYGTGQDIPTDRLNTGFKDSNR